MPAPIWTVWVVLALAAWVLLAWLCKRLLDNPREDVSAGLAMIVMRLAARFVHRLRVEGLEHIPRGRPPEGGPLVLVSNHTAGIDPVLVQVVCDFEVRFLMSREMQLPSLKGLWDFLGTIPVDPDGKDTASVRTAIKYVKDGGVVGVFPEGGIERPARRVMPFAPGVGLIVSRTGARVLQVIISDTPYTQTAWGSLICPSRSVLRFLPLKDYSKSKMGAAEIAQDLHDRMVRETGWAESEAGRM